MHLCIHVAKMYISNILKILHNFPPVFKEFELALSVQASLSLSCRGTALEPRTAHPSAGTVSDGSPRDVLGSCLAHSTSDFQQCCTELSLPTSPMTAHHIASQALSCSSAHSNQHTLCTGMGSLLTTYCLPA